MLSTPSIVGSNRAHETKKNQRMLIEKYIESRINKVMSQKNEVSDPGEKQIADWYRTELTRL